MGIQEYNSSDGGGGKTAGEQVNDKNPSGDEKDAAGGVEGEAMVGWEVGGDFGRGL